LILIIIVVGTDAQSTEHRDKKDIKNNQKYNLLVAYCNLQ